MAGIFCKNPVHEKKTFHGLSSISLVEEKVALAGPHSKKWKRLSLHFARGNNDLCFPFSSKSQLTKQKAHSVLFSSRKLNPLKKEHLPALLRQTPMMCSCSWIRENISRNGNSDGRCLAEMSLVTSALIYWILIQKNGRIYTNCDLTYPGRIWKDLHWCVFNAF